MKQMASMGLTTGIHANTIVVDVIIMLRPSARNVAMAKVADSGNALRIRGTIAYEVNGQKSGRQVGLPVV